MNIKNITNNLLTIVCAFGSLALKNHYTFFDKNTEEEHEVWELDNLPQRIEDLNGHVINIVYDAQGQKVSYTDNSKPHTNKLYSNGFVYQNETLKYMPLPEGYYSDGEYFAVIRDYLGSVRVVLKNNASTYNLSNEVLEVNHYDPWGVEFGMSEEPFGVQDYKHQGKERMNIFGKNMHDHGARYASHGRWDSPDPLQEIFYPVSPYAFCNNNPVRYIDPDGRKIVLSFTNKKGSIENITYRSGKTVNAASGEIFKLISQLEEAKRADPKLYDMIQQLENSPHTHKIIINDEGKHSSEPENQRNKNNGIGTGSIIQHDLVKSEHTGIFHPMPSLVHELKHSYDSDRGTTNRGTTQNGIRMSEVDAVNMENRARAAAGLVKRTHYGDKEIPDYLLEDTHSNQDQGGESDPAKR